MTKKQWQRYSMGLLMGAATGLVLPGCTQPAAQVASSALTATAYAGQYGIAYVSTGADARVADLYDADRQFIGAVSVEKSGENQRLVTVELKDAVPSSMTFEKPASVAWEPIPLTADDVTQALVTEPALRSAFAKLNVLAVHADDMKPLVDALDPDKYIQRCDGSAYAPMVVSECATTGCTGGSSSGTATYNGVTQASCTVNNLCTGFSTASWTPSFPIGSGLGVCSCSGSTQVFDISLDCAPRQAGAGQPVDPCSSTSGTDPNWRTRVSKLATHRTCTTSSNCGTGTTTSQCLQCQNNGNNCGQRCPAGTAVKQRRLGDALVCTTGSSSSTPIANCPTGYTSTAVVDANAGTLWGSIDSVYWCVSNSTPTGRSTCNTGNGQCNYATLPTYTLTVDDVTGSSSLGFVSSTPVGIVSCSSHGGGVCSSDFNQGLQVTLTATTWPPYGTFVGWGGACSGTSLTCVVTMDAAKNVTATFGCQAGHTC